MTPDPDDQLPQTAPLVRREADRREVQLFYIRYGTRGLSFTSYMTVRRDPATEVVTVALGKCDDDE
jgi:hypothetical protein